MSANATASGTGVTLNFSGESGGSTFVDGGGYCFTRVNPTFSQKEWGAWSDGSTVDTPSLQKWIDANQPHIAVAGNSIIDAPLTCGLASDIATIQGPPTQGVAEGGTYIPLFQITAASPAPLLTSFAMLIMEAAEPDNTPVRCAIHAVGLIGDGSGAYDIVDAMGHSDTIDDHSYLSGGCNNLNTINPGANLQVFDSSLDNSFSDNASIGSPNVKLVRNSFAGAGTGYVNGTTTYCPNGPGGTPGTLVTTNNITFTGSDVVIADNIIQQARGYSIVASTARLMRITGNYFDNNAKADTGTHAAIDIKNSSTITLCGNTFHRSGGAAASNIPPGISSHVYLEGADDSVSACGNVYLPGITSSDPGDPVASIAIRPLYDYDADPSAQLTNIAIADNLAPQNQNTGGALPGVLSPNAQILLASSLSPQVPKNYISGLTLSNGGSPTSSVVNIASGEATDSLGTTILKTSGCSVNVTGTPGLGGPDVTIGSFPATVYFFIVSGANGANAGCLASTSLTPSFLNIASYEIHNTGTGAPNSSTIINVAQSGAVYSDNLPSNPLAGMAAGDTVTDTAGYIPSGTTITSLKSFYAQYCTSLVGTCVNPAPASVAASGSLGIVQFPSGTSLSTIKPGMVVEGTDASNRQLFNSGAYVETVCPVSGGCVSSGSDMCTPGPGPCIVLTVPTLSPAIIAVRNSCSSAATACASMFFSGNFTVTLNKPVSVTGFSNTFGFKARHGLYRLAGALYTDASGNVVQFHQNDDSFRLVTPVKFSDSAIAHWISLTGTMSGTGNETVSVPSGIVVRAFGRCTASAIATLWPGGTVLGQTTGATGTFSTAPAYMEKAPAPDTPFPYQLDTDTSQQIKAQAATNVTGTSINCMNDGWVFHRGQ